MNSRVISVRELSEKEYEQELCKTPDKKREQIRNYRPDDLKRTLAGRILLRRLIDEVYCRKDYTIRYNRNGKPMVDFCFFNISHSEDFACCAVSDKEIGVDIQKVAKVNKRSKYMLFSQEESRFVNLSNDLENAFYTIWTMKEAYVKALGGVLSDAAKINLVTIDNELQTSFGEYDFSTFAKDKYIYTVCEKVR